MNDAVMLIHANHRGFFSVDVGIKSDQRFKAWSRGLRPLRCRFAALRMTTREGV